MNTHAGQHARREGLESSGQGANPQSSAGAVSGELPGGAATVAAFPGRDGGVYNEFGDAPATQRSAARPARRWIIAVLLLVAAVVAWVALRDSGAPAPGADPAVAAGPLELAAVDVTTVEPRVLTRLLPLSGSVSPIVQATVKSKVSGDVQEFTVREGQGVRQGDVIARIDTRNLKAQYDRELAAVEKARADLDLATLNRDKNRMLLEQRFISQNTYEQTESAYAGSIANLKLAQAQAELARINLEDAVIRAPFSGTVARRLVQPGEKVSADTPVVAIVDLRQMLLESAVPASDIPAVRVGQEVRFHVNGFGRREFAGTVQRINPMTTDGSRAITVYVAVDNADGALKGGMFAQGSLLLESGAPVLAIPQRAIRQESGVPVVYTLRADGAIERRPVTLGPPIADQEFIEVRAGLTAGERVIVVDIGDYKPDATAVVTGA